MSSTGVTGTAAEAARRLRDEFLQQNRGPDYVPALTVRSFPSLGVSYRVWSTKSTRVCHLLSQLEFMAWLHAEFTVSVTDIREQFLVASAEEAADMARKLGLDPPCYSGSSPGPTTDLLLTTSQAGLVGYLAVNCKYQSDMKNPRVIELQAIEQELWSKRGVPWRQFNEETLSAAQYQNMLWLFAFRRPDRFMPTHSVLRDRLVDTMAAAVRAYAAVPVGELVTRIARTMGVPPGTVSAAVRFALAQGVLHSDLSIAFSPYKSPEELQWS